MKSMKRLILHQSPDLCTLGVHLPMAGMLGHSSCAFCAWEGAVRTAWTKLAALYRLHFQLYNVISTDTQMSRM